MGTQIQNSPSKSLKGTLARIMVALLLVLLALPVFYLGILGIYSLFWKGFAITPYVVITLAPIFIVECVWNTLIVPMCVDDCRGAGRVLPGLGFHRISVLRSIAEFVHILVLGNYVSHSVRESGLDSLVAPRASRVEVGGVTGR